MRPAHCPGHSLTLVAVLVRNVPSRQNLTKPEFKFADNLTRNDLTPWSAGRSGRREGGRTGRWFAPGLQLRVPLKAAAAMGRGAAEELPG